MKCVTVTNGKLKQVWKSPSLISITYAHFNTQCLHLKIKKSNDFLTPKMKALWSFEMSGITCRMTQRSTSEYLNLYSFSPLTVHTVTKFLSFCTFYILWYNYSPNATSCAQHIFWKLKSVIFLDFKQQSIPEEQRSHFHCSRSLKSCILDFIIYSNTAHSQGVWPQLWI